jgi:hypothetical protein
VLRQALLYQPGSLSPTTLIALIHGVEDPTLDVVQFDDEAGGTSERDLAIPFLPDMDEVVVAKAELIFGARRTEQTIAGYRVATATGDDVGMVIALDRPARLAKLVIGAPTVAPGAVAEGEALHYVVRSAEPLPGPATGFKFGPPIFADPPFALESKLYGPVLGGLTVVAVDGGGVQIRFPDILGSGWLIQRATGSEATKLKPVAFTSSVTSVTVAAAVSGLALTAVGATPQEDTILWSSANALVPDGGAQIASFTPVAQKTLTRALTAANSTTPAVTLPLALRFTASSGGRLGITAKTLDVTYRVHPLGRGPTKLSLAGVWTPLALRAPAGRRAQSARIKLVAKHRGRELNDGSPTPPVAWPGAGVRIDGTRSAATAAWLAPLAGAPQGWPLELVAVSVPVEAVVQSEAVLEVRHDAGGGPGQVIAAAVRQFRPGDQGWVDFELAPALVAGNAGVPLWISLRTTKGELRWFAGGSPGTAGRVSTDGRVTWDEVDPLLLPSAGPLVALFHAVPPPLAAPLLQFQAGDSRVGEMVLGGPAASDPHEFSSDSAAVDASLVDGLLTALGNASGSGRVRTDLLAFSRAVIDLTVAELTLDYDPHGAA